MHYAYNYNKIMFIDYNKFNIYAVDGLSKPLNMYSDEISSYVLKIWKDNNVKLYFNNFVNKIDLISGDTISLIKGGHGINIEKSCKFIETKQGPYNPKTDKKRF